MLTGTTHVIRPNDMQRIRKRRQLACLAMRRRQINSGPILVRGKRGKRNMERAVGVSRQNKKASLLLDVELIAFAKSLATNALLHMHASRRKTMTGADVVDAAKLMGVHHLHRNRRRRHYRRKPAGSDNAGASAAAPNNQDEDEASSE